MKTHEYKTLLMKSNFRSRADVVEMDRIINDSAGKGWELVTTTSIGNSVWNEGKTNGMLLTFRRETGAADRDQS